MQHSLMVKFKRVVPTLALLLSHCSPVALGPVDSMTSEEGESLESSERPESPTRGRIVVEEQEGFAPSEEEGPSSGAESSSQGDATQIARASGGSSTALFQATEPSGKDLGSSSVQESSEQEGIDPLRPLLISELTLEWDLYETSVDRDPIVELAYCSQAARRLAGNPTEPDFSDSQECGKVSFGSDPSMVGVGPKSKTKTKLSIEARKTYFMKASFGGKGLLGTTPLRIGLKRLKVLAKEASGAAVRKEIYFDPCVRKLLPGDSNLKSYLVSRGDVAVCFSTAPLESDAEKAFDEHYAGQRGGDYTDDVNFRRLVSQQGQSIPEWIGEGSPDSLTLVFSHSDIPGTGLTEQRIELGSRWQPGVRIERGMRFFDWKGRYSVSGTEFLTFFIEQERADPSRAYNHIFLKWMLLYSYEPGGSKFLGDPSNRGCSWGDFRSILGGTILSPLDAGRMPTARNASYEIPVSQSPQVGLPNPCQEISGG